MAKNLKLLDLDQFVPDVKTIKLGGVSHAMKEITVAEYIAKTKALKEAKTTDDSVADQIEQTVQMITEGFPTIPVETLKAMSLQMLTAILEFIVKPPAEIANEVEAAQGNG